MQTCNIVEIIKSNSRLVSVVLCLYAVVSSVPTFAQQLKYQPTLTDKTYDANFGNYFPMYVANRVPYIDVYIEDPTGWGNTSRGTFLLDHGTDTSTIDLNGFLGNALNMTKDHRYTMYFKSEPRPGAIYNGPHTPPFMNEQIHGRINANGIRQSGIVGTDVLSKIIVTFDYKYSRVYITDNPQTKCTPEIMTSEGFFSAETKGMFSNDEAQLEWKKKWDLKSKNNNPHVPIVIGDSKRDASARALIDPGFDDYLYHKGAFYSHCININQVYFDSLLKQDIIESVDKVNYILLGNVAGISDSLFECKLKKNSKFSIVSTKGNLIFPYSTDSIHVFLKVNGYNEKGESGSSAGGITTFPFAAAQFGGSFLLDFDMVTFDPFRSLIWFLKPEGVVKSRH